MDSTQSHIRPTIAVLEDIIAQAVHEGSSGLTRVRVLREKREAEYVHAMERHSERAEQKQRDNWLEVKEARKLRRAAARVQRDLDNAKTAEAQNALAVKVKRKQSEPYKIIEANYRALKAEAKEMLRPLHIDPETFDVHGETGKIVSRDIYVTTGNLVDDSLVPNKLYMLRAHGTVEESDFEPLFSSQEHSEMDEVESVQIGAAELVRHARKSDRNIFYLLDRKRRAEAFDAEFPAGLRDKARDDGSLFESTSVIERIAEEEGGFRYQDRLPDLPRGVPTKKMKIGRVFIGPVAERVVTEDTIRGLNRARKQQEAAGNDGSGGSGTIVKSYDAEDDETDDDDDEVLNDIIRKWGRGEPMPTKIIPTRTNPTIASPSTFTGSAKAGESKQPTTTDKIKDERKIAFAETDAPTDIRQDDGGGGRSRNGGKRKDKDKDKGKGKAKNQQT